VRAVSSRVQQSTVPSSGQAAPQGKQRLWRAAIENCIR
jgi:hypothetical protein